MLNGFGKAMLATSLLCAITVTFAREVAPTPPMGWNSWDSFGLTIDEADFKANALELAKLRAYGWTYAVIDEGWYMGNPFGDKLQSRQYFLDAHGLLIPAPARYPSSADHQGFKPLADWLHSRGLKFGLHIVRGIPKQAVENNLPIAGSFHAVDAADTADTCGWDDGNYGVRDNPAGQAYYDAMLSLYAGWGLDFLKVDCIADHPYKASEIRQIAAAIGKTGRPIVLSLSPGPTQPAHAAEIRKYAQMWRISNDVWDRWHFVHEPPKEDDFPMGVRDIFDRLQPWIGQARDGHWPDADMLPFGMLAPHPGLGEPRHTHLTLDEERSQLTLSAMARSPLILGANLTRLDAETRALITNRDVITVNQTARDNHPVDNLPPGLEKVRVWVAAGTGRQQSQRFVAVFNLDDEAASVEVPWGQLGLNSGSFAARDLWEGHPLGASERLKIMLPAHGCVLYALNK